MKTLKDECYIVIKACVSLLLLIFFLYNRILRVHAIPTYI